MIHRALASGAIGLLALLSSACVTDAGAPQTVASATPAEPAAAAAPAEPAAAAAPAAPATQQAANKFDPDQKVCRIYEVTGTRIAKQKICKTRQQWEDETRAYQDSIRGVQDSANAQPGGESLGTGR
jgi:hypothetical protein